MSELPDDIKERALDIANSVKDLIADFENGIDTIKRAVDQLRRAKNTTLLEAAMNDLDEIDASHMRDFLNGAATDIQDLIREANEREEEEDEEE